jgi:hypothetical protein
MTAIEALVIRVVQQLHAASQNDFVPFGLLE